MFRLLRSGVGVFLLDGVKALGFYLQQLPVLGWCVFLGVKERRELDLGWRTHSTTYRLCVIEL